MSKKITIKDIASMANVSYKTVSRVLNNENNIKKETREKVEKILREYNFSKNFNAINLSSNTNKQIGLITNVKEENIEFNKNFILAHEIIKLASKYNYTVIPVKSFNDLKKNRFNKVDKGFYDGIIALNPKDIKELDEIYDSKLPLIVSGVNEKYPYVGTDQEDSAYIATKTLIEKGCKNITFLLGDPETITTKLKLKGYLKAIKEYSLNENYIYSFINSNSVEEYVKEKYLSNNLEEALIINSDFATLGAIRAINKYSIKNLKIISFGNIYICNEVYPAISSMKQNFSVIAEYLLTKIIFMIENNKDNIESKLIPSELVIRDTCN